MRTFLRHVHWLLFFALVFFFVRFAEVDLWLSRLFFNTYSKQWTWGTNPIIEAIYVFFRYIPFLLVPLLLVACVWAYKRMGAAHNKFRCALFLLLTLAIGPGLIVHTVFKEGFDRPRPREVQEFGGTKAFSPAFIISKPCDRGCASFQSGHAAMGFWFMALAWVMRKRWLFVAGLAVGSLAAFGRIVQGGHFLSDTIFAGFTCYFVCRYLSYRLLGYSEISPLSLGQSAQILWKTRFGFFPIKATANG